MNDLTSNQPHYALADKLRTRGVSVSIDRVDLRGFLGEVDTVAIVALGFVLGAAAGGFFKALGKDTWELTKRFLAKFVSSTSESEGSERHGVVLEFYFASPAPSCEVHVHFPMPPHDAPAAAQRLEVLEYGMSQIPHAIEAVTESAERSGRTIAARYSYDASSGKLTRERLDTNAGEI